MRKRKLIKEIWEFVILYAGFIRPQILAVVIFVRRIKNHCAIKLFQIFVSRNLEINLKLLTKSLVSFQNSNNCNKLQK